MPIPLVEYYTNDVGKKHYMGRSNGQNFYVWAASHEQAKNSLRRKALVEVGTYNFTDFQVKLKNGSWGRISFGF